MLVMLTDTQLILPQAVCQTCLMADQNGNPRWHGGMLSCGRQVAGLTANQPVQFECEMGFKIADIHD
jgi:hypothetical protein